MPSSGEKAPRPSSAISLEVSRLAVRTLSQEGYRVLEGMEDRHDGGYVFPSPTPAWLGFFALERQRKSSLWFYKQAYHEKQCGVLGRAVVRGLAI